MSLPDAAARAAAIDPALSVCVSAPAGSGKTGLLVCRYLTLLARVGAPENVVAITFTRKAAAEMRARVSEALHAAARGESGNDAHERDLLAAASAVLHRSDADAWDLLGHPTRLAIQTIDSFCGELTRQMPLLSGCGGPISAADDADPLFQRAVERFLRRELEKGGATSDVERLLLHLDNRWDSVCDLLIQLLKRREQWQPVFGATGIDSAERSIVREAVADLVGFRIERLREDLAPWLSDLETAFAWRAQHLPEAPGFNPREDTLASWRPLATLCQTKSGEWRKRLNRNDGFPAGQGEAGEHKAALLEILDAWRQEKDDGLRRAVGDLLLLPDPGAESAQDHWDVLTALTRLLPRLVAELMLVFRESGEVDHAQIATAALAALGTDEAPTDIALRLDHRIEHLLVDEFQDTSSLQFELLRRLTRGWADDEGAGEAGPRTLLVVGDPMQSIYGFREANVGLFIRARDEGIGDLHLEPLELTVNFRSTATLVDWSNRVFSRTFPVRDEPDLGAVTFSRANAARSAGDAPTLALFYGSGAEEAEVDALCDAVAAGLADPGAPTLAILGRSRNQLRPFLAGLRDRGIPYAARDFDPLGSRAIVRDLVSLTSVLLDPLERFGWLSLLRTPAIALTNADLLVMAQAAPIPESLCHGDIREAVEEALSPEGRERVRHLIAVLTWARHYRDRLAIRVWVEETWLRLGGAGALASQSAVDDAQAFFRLLERLDHAEPGFTAPRLRETLDSLYAEPAEDPRAVQVMTLHKAKGLEFDRVYLPALARGTRRSDRPLLLWDELTLPGRSATILLDVRDEVGKPTPGRLYDFLGRQQERKRDYEAARLLYVGCTRAREQLWLSASLSEARDGEGYNPPRDGSLLAHLWPGLDPEPPATLALGEAEEAVEAAPYRRLERVDAFAAPPALAGTQPRGIDFRDNREARALGTAVHRVLEALAHRRALPTAEDPSLRPLLKQALTHAGVGLGSLEARVAEGMDFLNRSLADPWLRWALDPARAQRRAEWTLTAVGPEGPQTLVLDYVFFDAARAEHWIIDYKTSQPETGTCVDTFLALEATRYAPQLRSYAEALAPIVETPVRCALYFPALAQRIEVEQGKT